MNFIFKLITSFFSLTIILLYLYMRFTQKHNIVLLQTENIAIYYSYFLYLFIFSMVIFALLLVFLLLGKLEIKTNITFHNFFSKINYRFSKINIFYKTYGIIFDFIGPRYTQHLVFFTDRFISWKAKTKLYLIIVNVILPRLIIILILIFEVYNQKLHYYFYSLLLLFIPLIFRLFIFVLNDIGPRLLPEFKKMLEIDTSDKNTIVIETPKGIKKGQLLGFKFKSEYRQFDLDHFMFNFFYPMASISSEMELNFSPLYTKITRITIFVYYLIHLFCWGYILFLI